MKLSAIEQTCRKLVCADVSPVHILVLSALSGAELTMTNISKLCSFTTSAATGAVDRLEKLGLVEREHDSTDRRSVKVKITANGRTKLQSVAA